MRRLALGLTILALVPAITRSQTVPGVAVDLTGGLGSHTMRTPVIYYSDGLAGFVRFAATFRLGPPGWLRPILAVERSPGCGFGWRCAGSKNCLFAPNSHVYCDFPTPIGNAIGVGLAWSTRGAAGASVSAGQAWYAHRARYVAAGIALPVSAHIAVVGDSRYIATKDDFGDRAWMLPFSIGLRVR